MLHARRLYLREKQAFTKENDTLRLLGKPMDVIRHWQKEGIELIHIVDLDAQRGMKTNWDVYDTLTYTAHIQVEGGADVHFIEKLLGINARVVIPLPTKLPLKKWTEKKRLLVGKISSDYDGSVEDVHDVLLENATAEAVKKFAAKGKRILVYQKEYQKEMDVFAVVKD